MIQCEYKSFAQEQTQKHTTIINGYEIFEILGKGSFGEVFKAKKDDKIYALKLLDFDTIKKRKLEKFVSNEINLMRQMNHPNVVKIYDAFYTQNVIFLVLEYCNQGTLLTHVSKNKPNVKQCVDLFIQVLAGVKHIHEQGVLHRDLKLENIFINDGVLKIADFGLAQFEQDEFIYCGTKFYMAPEILEHKQASYKSDLWSLGVILFSMIFRTLPFQSKTDLISAIQSQTDPSFNIHKFFKGRANYLSMITSDIQDFFEQVFVFDMNKRIEFKELFNLMLIERQMKLEEKKESLIFYSKLDILCPGELLDKRNSSNYCSIVEQNPNLHFEPKKQLQEYSANYLNRIKEQTNSTQQSSSNPCSSLRVMQFSTIQITVSQQCEDIPEEEASQINNIFPSENNQTDLKKRNHCIQSPRALDINKRIISSQSIQQLRLDYSILEKLTPKMQSNNDLLFQNIQSEIEGNQNIINASKQEVISSNVNKTQLCSQIKISILSFITDEFPLQFQAEFTQLKSIVQKYQLLDEVLCRLQEFNLGYSTQCLINFIIAKVIIFLINTGKNYIEKSSQDFKRQNLTVRIQSMFINDLKSWENKMFMYKNGIDLENDIKQQNLKNIILNEKTEFAYIKDVIQPFCVVIELLFTNIFQLSQSSQSQNPLRFKKYCFLLMLILNIQSVFNKQTDEMNIFEEFISSQLDINPQSLIEYIDGIKSTYIFDTLLIRFVNTCPMSIPNIKMIDIFCNRKYY